MVRLFLLTNEKAARWSSSPLKNHQTAAWGHAAYRNHKQFRSFVGPVPSPGDFLNGLLANHET